jgi:hypothetical protein
MTSPVLSSHRGFPRPEPFSIEEDSVILRAVACVPIIGTVVSLRIETSLNEKMKIEKNESTVIELLEIKNQYKVANMIRNLITIAVVVSLLASRIIPLTIANEALAGGCVGILVAAAGISFHQRNVNMKTIREIQTTGYTPTMRIL